MPGGIELKADPGAGLAGVGVTYRWDLDGDGVPDRKPDATAKTPPELAFIDSSVLTVRPGDIGSSVTLWVRPAGGGKGVTVTRSLEFAEQEIRDLHEIWPWLNETGGK